MFGPKKKETSHACDCLVKVSRWPSIWVGLDMNSFVEKYERGARFSALRPNGCPEIAQNRCFLIEWLNLLWFMVNNKFYLWV